jgi:hypothetical protein
MDERFTYNRRAPKLIKQAVNACTSVPPEEEQREREKERKKKREQRESRKQEWYWSGIRCYALFGL